MVVDYAVMTKVLEKKGDTLTAQVKYAAMKAALESALNARRDGKSTMDVNGIAYKAAQATIPVVYEQLTTGKTVSEHDTKELAAWDWAKDALEILPKYDAEQKLAQGG